MTDRSYREALPSPRLEQEMGTWKKQYTENEALVEANRCLFCHDAPCISACPTSIDIPEFIRRIATRDHRGAARKILEANVLGLSCGIVCPVEVLCVGDCVYNHMGVPPIQIGKLQYFAVRDAYDRGIRFWDRGAPTGLRVACLGAGPASLAAAHELTRLGHEVVVFEKRRLPGGLNTTGVAPYKMKAEESLEEVEWVQKIGFEIRRGVEVGKDLSFAELERQFDAVFIGVGLGPDSYLSIPGRELRSVAGAVDLIERFKNEPRLAMDGVRSVVVVGGGNTALDVVRETTRLGVASVTLVYRRAEDEMTGYDHEHKAAAQEGVRFLYQAHPVAFLGDGAVRSVRLVRTRSGPTDSAGRSQPVPVAGSEFEIPADLVVLAIGQSKLESLFSKVPGIVFEGGRLQVDPETYRTGNPRYYGGGDCVNGGKEVVNAAAHGRIAARAMDQALATRSKEARA